MSDEVRLTSALAAGALLSFVLTPVAIRLAVRLDFHDQPNVDYKRHRPATPYLGGAAMLLAVVVAAGIFGGGFSRYAILIGCAAGLWVVGTLDDRFGLPPAPRVLAEAGVAVALWASGHGWHAFELPGMNLLLTVLWVVGIVNACNLLDNMDGSAGSVVAASAAGIAGVALIRGNVVLAALCLALAGSCAGFLPFNLRPPARIYMGDGGSMPLGFLLAAAAMNLGLGRAFDEPALLAGGLLVGVPIFDTALVSISRRRRGISLLQGGRDHSTHRLAARFGSTWRASLVLAAAQVLLCGLAAGAAALGSTEIVVAAGAAVVAGCIGVVVLESPGFAPDPARQQPGVIAAEPALSSQR